MPPPTTTVSHLSQRKRKLAPPAIPHTAEASTLSPLGSTSTKSTNSDEEADAGDGAYSPVLRGSKPRRPSFKAAGGGKNAKSAGGRPLSREQLRKANHSLIERRRREKINSSLGELRSMVPGLGDEGAGKGGEFKLEVLERTVEHMRLLQQRIADLESQLDSVLPVPTKIKRSRSANLPVHQTDDDSLYHKTDLPSLSQGKRAKTARATSPSPPTPSLSPEQYDPNETESELNLPPPMALAARTETSGQYRSPSLRPHPPSISSLLVSAQSRPLPSTVPSTRPLPPPQAANPTLYLPFPTPSPTSPFLNYHPSASGGPYMGPATEPSPFLAPLQNLGLFGGAIALDPGASPHLTSGSRKNSLLTISSMSSEESLRGHRGRARHGLNRDGIDPASRGMGAEEAANLLLAFSSPDTLRPQGCAEVTKMVPVDGGRLGYADGRASKGALENEHFTLDTESVAGMTRESEKRSMCGLQSAGMVGKTARDILRM